MVDVAPDLTQPIVATHVQGVKVDEAKIVYLQPEVGARKAGLKGYTRA